MLETMFMIMAFVAMTCGTILTVLLTYVMARSMLEVLRNDQ